MDHNFTQQIKDWLDTPTEERDFEKGALYLLKLSGNQIMYRNNIANPKGKAAFIEYQLQKYYNFRVQDLTREQVAVIEQQVESIVAEHIPLATEADTKQKGKRENHDLLPDEIKAKFVENLKLHRRDVRARSETPHHVNVGSSMPGTETCAIPTPSSSETVSMSGISLIVGWKPPPIPTPTGSWL